MAVKRPVNVYEKVARQAGRLITTHSLTFSDIIARFMIEVIEQ